MKPNTPTPAERTNDVTVMYGVMARLSRMASTFESEIGTGVGARVTGEGRVSGEFVDGWLTEGPLVVSKTFTVDGDAPAWKLLEMIEELEAFGPGETAVDVDVSGSVRGFPPKINDAGNVIPRGPDVIDPEKVRHTAVVTVEADLTGWMAGAEEGR